MLTVVSAGHSAILRAGQAPGAANPDFTARMYDSMLIKRIADPSEIVGAALFLASDASGFATGTTVTVDGGISA